MGCFKFISSLINTIFMLIVALILLFPCGGLNLIKNTIYGFFNPPEKILQVNAQKVADFSKISSQYELTKAFDLFGINAVIAQDKTSKQKMAIVNTGWIANFSKQDIQSNQILNKLDEISKNLEKIKIQNLKFDHVNIQKKGGFNAFNQEIPYIKGKIQLIGNNKQDIEGIVGVVAKTNSKNDLIISFNEPGKFNQKTAEKFFKQVKYFSDWN